MIDTPACPAAAHLQRFLLGRLSHEEAAAVGRHLFECGRCSAALRTLREGDGAVRETAAPVTAADKPAEAPAAAVVPPPPSGALTVTGFPSSLTPSGPTPLTPPAAEPTVGYYRFLAPPGKPTDLGRLGPYHVVGVLGTGGMGVVFHAYDPDLERPVALKAMLPALAANDAAKKRFLREARAAAAVKHDHVVVIYQVGEERGAPFLAMELLEGESLEDRLKREGRLPLTEVLRIGRETAEGLAAAHKRGLIHRDVKPGNIWLEGDQGRVKILDFGLVYAAQAAEEGPAPADAGPVPDHPPTALTLQGAVMGTPAYMAPEQAEGRSVDARCDLFSLGCVLYRMAAGEQPFRGKTALSTLRAVCTAAPRPAEALNPGLPAPFCALLRSLLAKEAGERPPSAAAVAEAIRAMEREEAAPRRKPSRWRRAAVAAASLALVVAAGLFAFAVYRHITDRGQTALENPLPSAPVVRALTTEEMMRRPAAADALRRQDLPAAALAWAGFGDPQKAPPELVAVLGETRFRLLDVPSFPDYSPDGKLLTVGSGNRVMLFDADTGQYLRSFVGHTGRCGAVFHPGGRIIASAGDDHTIKLWDAATGREIRTLCGHTAGVQSLAFSPDGQTLVSAGKDNTVRFWRVATGEQWRLIQSRGVLGALAFQPKGDFLAGVGDDGALRIWDAADGTLRFEGRGTRPGNAKVAFNPNGKTLAGGNGVEVIIYDANTFKELKTIPAAADGLLAFAPDGRSLLTGLHYHAAGIVPTLRRWDLDTDKELPAFSLPDEQGWVHYRLSPDGKTLAAASYEERIMRVYDAATGRPRFPSSGHKQEVLAVAFSPDGKTLASGGRDRSVKIWDAATGKELRTLTGSSDAVLYVAFSPDSKTVAAGGMGKKVLLWDAASGQLLRPLVGAAAFTAQLAFSPNGRLLAGGSGDKNVYIWDVATGQVVNALRGHQNGVSAVAFSPDGQALASADWDGATKLWDVASGGKTLEAQPYSAQVRRLAFFPDGKTLAGAAADGRVVFWSVVTGERRRVLANPPDASAVSIRADGRAAAASGTEGTVRLWDLAADPPSERIWRLSPDFSPIWSVAGSPEGRYLAAPGKDGLIRVLRVPEQVPPEPPPPVVPFRLDLNGLAGRRSLDATAFPPSWRKEGVFAAVNGPGEATFPSVPATRYVWNVDLDLRSLGGGALHFQTGDLDVVLDGDNSETVRCKLYHKYIVQWSEGERRFNRNGRLRLSLVVTETHARLLCDDVPALDIDCKPIDLALHIRSEGQTDVTVTRCSCRPPEDDDLGTLGLPLPAAGPALDPAAAASRVNALAAGLGDQPAEGKRFASGAGAMAWVAPGEFGLGADGAGAQAWSRKHPVRLTKGFWVGQNLVTQGEWAALMPANPSRFQGSPYLPVDTVRWDDAMRFCRLLTEREKTAGRVPPGYEYRLPTEAEWEYAGRAGSDEDAVAGPEQSWYDLTSTRQPHEVGSMPPNRWGLYDMQGNLRQWCLDAWYDYPKPEAGTDVDPAHFGDPATGEFVIRGGAWWSRRGSNGIFRRDFISSDKAVSIGFRVVLGPALRKD